MRNLTNKLIFFLTILFISIEVAAQGISVIENQSLFYQLHIQHVFIGSSLILLVMCFAWAKASRSYIMAILALFFAVKSLSILAVGGISLFALINDNVHFLNAEGVFFTCLANILFFIFTVKLLKFKKGEQKSYQLLWRLSIVIALIVPLTLIVNIDFIWLLARVTTTISLFALLFITKKEKAIDDDLLKIFTLILIVQLSFNILAYFLYFLGFATHIVNCLDMLAFCLMAIMVTYLVGYTYYCQLRDEKLAQQQVLSSMKAFELAQKELLIVQDESQEQLESRVQERTLELNIALQELEAVNQELKEKNTLDELSGLYNRRYYDQKIVAEFRRSRRNLTPLSLILVDIDHFKSVNDNFGHLTGDKCIVEVACLLKSLLRRSSDVACRYGGEEFCLILPETDAQGALVLAQEICESVREQKFCSNESVIKLSVSCGVTTYQQEKEITPEIIFKHVDKALYKAKESGRDQVQVMPIEKIPRSS